jgi:hypothetical protein
MVRTLRTGVRTEQRHTRANPCRVCGGHKDAPSGSGERCWGFDGEHGVYCTEVESDDWSEEAEAWFHPYDDAPEVSVNGRRQDPDAGAAVRLTVAQLAKEKALPTATLKEHGARQDGNGVRLGAKVRLRGDQKYAWERGCSPKTHPLFPMPGETVGETIVIPAGETDALTMRNAGREAYGITSGEKTRGALTAAHYRDLMKRGAREVVICGDGDDQGQAWMRSDARAAQDAGLRVSICDLSPLYDHFGGGIKDLNELWQAVGCDVDEFLRVVDEHTHALPSREDVALDDFLKAADEEINWLVDGLIARDEIVLIAAPQKSYKTWLTIALCRSLATRTPFLRSDWVGAERYRVLFIEEEGNRIKLAQRFRAADFRGDVTIRHKQGTDLTSGVFAETLIEDIRQGAYDVLILDPLQRMAPGLNENDSGEMGRFWDNIHRISRECPGLTIVILHHFNKGQHLGWLGVRGSSRTAGEADVGFFLEKTDDGVNLAIDGRDIPQYHDMDEAFQVDVEIDLDRRVLTMEINSGVTVKVRKASGAGRPSKGDEVLSLFESNPTTWFTQAQGAERTGMAESTFFKYRKGLFENGILECSGGKYRLKQGEES